MTWTAESACAALATAGVVVAPGDVRLTPRDDRRYARLPGDRIAWFADNDVGRRRLAFERRVLRLVASRCTFRVPRVAFDPETSAVHGVFDYEGACWADRHHDFRYLLFDFDRDEMLDAALAVYEPAVGRRLSCERVVLYNAACSATFLAFRDGVAPAERSCGRTLAEDLAWIRAALGRVEASRATGRTA